MYQPYRGLQLRGSTCADFVHADALIVGTSLKVDGQWQQDIDPRRAESLVQAFRAARDSRR